MKVRVRVFASLREEVGEEVVEIELDNPTTVEGVLAAFTSAYPAGRSVGRALVAVNQEIADKETPVQKDDEIALLPPVSGG